MIILHRHFSRADLAEAAEQLLADRRAGDPEAVKRGFYTPEKAARRERVAAAIAMTMRAAADRRDPGDPEQHWLATDGREGASWSEIRADLATTFEIARTAALQPGAPSSLEDRALRIGALVSWFRPVVPDGTQPLILAAVSIERELASAASARRATPAPLPPRPRREPVRAGNLFA